MEQVPVTSGDDRWSAGPRTPLAWSLWLYATHPALPSLALVAAAGRAVQVGWSQAHAPSLYWWFELPIEGARIALLVALVGAGSLGRGVAVLRGIRQRTEQDTDVSLWTRARAQRGALLKAALAIAAFTALVNLTVHWLSSTPAAHGIARALLGADNKQAETAATLFLKNLTVIPIFMAWYAGVYRLLRSTPLHAP